MTRYFRIDNPMHPYEDKYLGHAGRGLSQVRSAMKTFKIVHAYGGCTESHTVKDRTADLALEHFIEERYASLCDRDSEIITRFTPKGLEVGFLGQGHVHWTKNYFRIKRS